MPRCQDVSRRCYAKKQSSLKILDLTSDISDLHPYGVFVSPERALKGDVRRVTKGLSQFLLEFQ